MNFLDKSKLRKRPYCYFFFGIDGSQLDIVVNFLKVDIVEKFSRSAQ